MRGKIMNYIYDYISEERKKEIAYMNIVDTYNRTGYFDTYNSLTPNWYYKVLR